jgi:hypothetical protein
MKLKLDENLSERGRSQLQHAGHDVATVPEQALTSATDADLIRMKSSAVAIGPAWALFRSPQTRVDTNRGVC